VLHRSSQADHSPPDGWTIRPAIAEDFCRPGSVMTTEFWQSADDFLAHGGRWQIEHGGSVGAQAFPSFRFDDELELGIETAAEHRRSGLVAAVAAHMIADLLTREITSVWACRASNIGSVRLAANLGFRVVRRLNYFRLPSGNPGHLD
jgi:hypothetical protein